MALPTRDLNVGFSAMVSVRALMCPTAASFAQPGIKPQRSILSPLPIRWHNDGRVSGGRDVEVLLELEKLITNLEWDSQVVKLAGIISVAPAHRLFGCVTNRGLD